MTLTIFLIQWILFSVLCIRKIRIINSIPGPSVWKTKDASDRVIAVLVSSLPFFNIILLGYMYIEGPNPKPKEGTRLQKFLKQE